MKTSIKDRLLCAGLGILFLVSVWMEIEEGVNWLDLIFLVSISVFFFYLAISNKNPNQIFSGMNILNFFRIKRNKPIYNKAMAVFFLSASAPAGLIAMINISIKDDGDPAIMVSGVIFATLFLLGLSLLSKDISQVLQKDRRKGVLYLRPFDSDHKDTFGEFYLKMYFEPIGPLLAIGRPHELFQPYGAGRFYINENWQDKVSKLIEEASLVIIRIGSSQGLLWELQALKRLADPQKTLLYIPEGIQDKKSKPHLDFQDFQKTFREIFENELELIEKNIKFVWFDPKWKPIYLKPKKARKIIAEFLSFYYAFTSLKPVYQFFQVDFPQKKMRFWALMLPLSIIAALISLMIIMEYIL